MARSDDPRQQYLDERRRITGDFRDPGPDKKVDALPAVDADPILEVLDALDETKGTPIYRPNGRIETKTNNTLRTYAARLRLVAGELDTPLLELPTEDVAGSMDDLADGTADVAPSGGYADGTLTQYRAALVAFYRYHDTAVDADRIPLPASARDDSGAFDGREMFDEDEVDRLREAVTDTRTRALLELMIYTGQRLRVIQRLTVDHVDLYDGSTGTIRIPDVDGTKGASGKRPLLGARRYVRDWLNLHPCPDDRDAALITTSPGNSNRGEPGEPLATSTIRYHLKRLADEAGIDRDRMYPHHFRHYFTTVAKRDFGMDDAHIRKLRGDSPGSRVMETTYQHLSDEDAIRAAEEASGMVDEDDEEDATAFTPPVCPTCERVLSRGAKACQDCGEVFRPDAEATRRELQQQAESRMVEVETPKEARIVSSMLSQLRSGDLPDVDSEDIDE